MKSATHKKGLARSLGEFFGHIARAVREPVARPPVLVRRNVEERRAPTAQGEILLRRTTIDEVLPPTPRARPQAAQPQPNQAKPNQGAKP